MVSQTNEQALEDCIEASLAEGSRYEQGSPADFDRKFAILKAKGFHSSVRFEARLL